MRTQNRWILGLTFWWAVTATIVPAQQPPGPPQLPPEIVHNIEIRAYLLHTILQTINKAPKTPEAEEIRMLLAPGDAPLAPGMDPKGDVRLAISPTPNGDRQFVIEMARDFDRFYFNDPIGYEARVLHWLLEIRGKKVPEDHHEDEHEHEINPQEMMRVLDLHGWYLELASRDRPSESVETRRLVEAYKKDGKDRGPIWLNAVSSVDQHDIVFSMEEESFSNEFLPKMTVKNSPELFVFLSKAVPRTLTAAKTLEAMAEKAVPAKDTPEYLEARQAVFILDAYFDHTRRLVDRVLNRLTEFSPEFIKAMHSWEEESLEIRVSLNKARQNAEFKKQVMDHQIPGDAPELTRTGQLTKLQFARWREVNVNRRAPRDPGA